MVWALILAAGESRRMGSPKLLLPFKSETLIETVVNNTIRSEVDKTLIVLGCNAEKIADKIEHFSIEMSVNPHFQEGMLSSIQWGLKNIPETAMAVMIVLGDQPSIPVYVFNRLIEMYRETGKHIVLPVYNHKRGHPILIDIALKREVMRLGPEEGLHTVIHNHAGDIVEVEVDAPGIARDVDTMEDYRKEIGG